MLPYPTHIGHIAYAPEQQGGLRCVLCGPYPVHACGPRIIENFLDMAHFHFIHSGMLGDPCYTEVPDYQVGPMVEYTYRVVRPLTAILTKLPQPQGGVIEAIRLFVQPLDEEHCQAWISLAMSNHTSSDEELRAFQDRIFLQDLETLKAQRPKKLLLEPGVEVPQRADRLSAAYRRMLERLGLRYGAL